MDRPPFGGSLRAGVGLASIGVGVLALGQPLGAATTANLSISATVVSSCAVTAGTLAFGSYDPTASGNVDQDGSFTVACTKGTVATVGLNAGLNASGGARRMSNGTDFLTYELYKETGRTNVWGESGGAARTLPAAPSNVSQAVNVHGRVAPAQNVGVGSYNDTVLITVTF